MKASPSLFFFSVFYALPCTREPVGPKRLKVRNGIAEEVVDKTCHRPCAADSLDLELCMILEDLRGPREKEFTLSKGNPEFLRFRSGAW